MHSLHKHVFLMVLQMLSLGVVICNHSGDSTMCVLDPCVQGGV
jgi:hypothetical protein